MNTMKEARTITRALFEQQKRQPYVNALASATKLKNELQQNACLSDEQSQIVTMALLQQQNRQVYVDFFVDTAKEQMHVKTI